MKPFLTVENNRPGANVKSIRDTRRAVEIVERAKAAVCQVFELKPYIMVEKSRRPDKAWPRQIAMALALDRLGGGLKYIGEKFGNRDHGTVLHASRLIKTQLEIQDRMTMRDWNDCVLAYERMMQDESYNLLTTPSTL